MKTRTDKQRRKRMLQSFLAIILIFIVFLLYLNTNDANVHRDRDAETTLMSYEKYNAKVNEVRYQEILHGMTHQKIKAHSKNGAVEMNQQNIEIMIDIAQSHNFKNKEMYLDMLQRWQKGDFSRVKGDHNNIRGLLTDKSDDSSAIGRASKTYERNFVQKVFKEDN